MNSTRKHRLPSIRQIMASLLFLGLTVSLHTQAQSSEAACTNSSTTASGITCLAQEFLATLPASQANIIRQELTFANASRYWSNLPTRSAPRLGLPLSDLSASSKQAAEKLLSAALSSQGQTSMYEIRAADGYLGRGRSNFSADLYNIFLLGEPSTSSPWILAFTGHHYTFIASIHNNQVSLTPNFVAVEPATWNLDGVDYAPMEPRRQAFIQLLGSLSTTELEAARLPGAGRLLGGPRQDNNFPSNPLGISAENLDNNQKELLRQAVALYAGDAADSSQLDAYLAEDAINQTHVGWAGDPGFDGRGDYIRIDGPRVWIEFQVQRAGGFRDTHYHSIWRDKERDYGAIF